MSLPSNTSRRSRGFTLMELLIVVAVLILLVVVTLPRVKYALDESKVRESSRQLNSYIALAKSRASSTGRPCGLWLARDLDANPTVIQSTQLFLAEIPPPYTGDFTDSRVVVSDSMGNPPTLANADWVLAFSPAAASLGVLVADGESFGIRFDHKGPLFPGYRNGTTFYIRGSLSPTLPPAANGNTGYSFEIIRNPVRIGGSSGSSRGTSIDLPYSGFGNYGQEFQVTTSHVLVMFSPDGHVFNASIGTTDSSGNATVITDDAPGTVHFLVGRPEKVGNPLATSNLFDSKALWVSVGRLTGSVVTTENAPNVNLPTSNTAEQQFFLLTAREFAITQDVKGGR